MRRADGVSAGSLPSIPFSLKATACESKYTPVMLHTMYLHFPSCSPCVVYAMVVSCPSQGNGARSRLLVVNRVIRKLRGRFEWSPFVIMPHSFAEGKNKVKYP